MACLTMAAIQPLQGSPPLPIQLNGSLRHQSIVSPLLWRGCNHRLLSLFSHVFSDLGGVATMAYCLFSSSRRGVRLVRLVWEGLQPWCVVSFMCSDKVVENIHKNMSFVRLNVTPQPTVVQIKAKPHKSKEKRKTLIRYRLVVMWCIKHPHPLLVSIDSVVSFLWHFREGVAGIFCISFGGSTIL